MPVLAYDDFIDKHKRGFCVRLVFREPPVRVSKSAAKQKGKGTHLSSLPAKNSKTVPPLNAMARELCKREVKGDYAVKAISRRTQLVVVRDEADARRFIQLFGGKRVEGNAPAFCAWVLECGIDRDIYARLTKELNLG